jgi:ParB/RepB/Spo0J family partition protein
MKIPLDQIKTSPRPIRSSLDEEKLEELAKSIKEQGLISPIKVRPEGEDSFEIVYGHRRVEAMRRIGATEVEAIVEGLDDVEQVLQQITENESREDVPYLEKAEGYQRAIETTGWSISKVATYIGVPESTLRQALNWLKEFHQGTAVVVENDAGIGPKDSGIIRTLEIARVFGDDVESKKAVAQKVGKEGLSRKQTRQLAESIAAAPSEKAKKILLDREFTPSIHDPEWIRERAKEYGPHDPIYRFDEKTKGDDWRESPEVKSVTDAILSWKQQIPKFQKTAEAGKMSPEAKQFIAHRIRQFARQLLEWAEELEGSRNEDKG